MKVLVLGATGMLGYSLFRNLSKYSDLNVYGVVRSITKTKKYFKSYEHKLLLCKDANNFDLLNAAINKVMPDVVINCIGLIKQHQKSNESDLAIEINALLPHRIAKICNIAKCKLVHFSTDCCFDGKLGGYTELDSPNSTDLYGRTKILGEIDYNPHLTLRTSIIGHELISKVSLIDWFLNQENDVTGYSKAIFSGLPTFYIAELLATKILRAQNLTGLYHLSGKPIDKYSLLLLVSKLYEKNIKIYKDKRFSIDRSLNSSLLQKELQFIPKEWPELIEGMHNDYTEHYNF